VASVPTAPLRAPRRSLADSLAVDAKGLSRQRATLDQLSRAYLTERLRRGEINQCSATNARCTLGALATYYGDGPARLLTRTDLDGWLETIGALAPATRRSRISTVKGLTAWMVRRDYLKADPAAELANVRLPRYLPRGLEVDAIGRLLEVCPDDRARLIVLLMVQEGLRAAEVAGLEVADISFTDHLALIHGKGGHERLLPLSDETWGILVRHLDAHPVTAGPVVRSYRRTWAGLRSDTISGMVSDWMNEAGIKRRPRDGVSGHALRHSCAGHMLKGGAHLRDVQAALGHVSLATTQRYLPLVVNDLRSAMGGRRYRGPL